MTNLRASEPSEETRLTDVSEQVSTVALLECARLLHERGNLTSGLTVVNSLRRVSDSRIGAKIGAQNLRSGSAVMRVLRNSEAQGHVEIYWSQDAGLRPYVVRLTPKGYATILGHKCHAAMCYPPTALAEETNTEPVMTYDGARLCLVAILHECGNQFTPVGLRRAFDYLEIRGRASRSQFIGSLESLGWIEVERTPTQPRPTLASVRLLARGFVQLHGHQCGANCTQPLA